MIFTFKINARTLTQTLRFVFLFILSKRKLFEIERSIRQDKYARTPNRTGMPRKAQGSSLLRYHYAIWASAQIALWQAKRTLRDMNLIKST